MLISTKLELAHSDEFNKPKINSFALTISFRKKNRFDNILRTILDFKKLKLPKLLNSSKEYKRDLSKKKLNLL